MQIKRGFSLVEVVIGAAMVLLTVTGMVSAYTVYVRAGLLNTTSLQVSKLLEEGLEAATLMRDGGWTTYVEPLIEDVDYHLIFENGLWKATTTEVLIDAKYKRTVRFSPVYRKVLGSDIVDQSAQDPKLLDPDTKKVTATVIWDAIQKIAVAFENGTTEGDLANFPSANAGNGDPAQSFTVGADPVVVSGVDLLLKRVPGTSPSTIFLEIRNVSTVGSVLATSLSVASSSISNVGLTWTAFAFPSKPTLSANTQYYLRLRSNPDSTVPFSGSSGTIYWGYQQTASSPYSGGSAWRYVGRLLNVLDSGQELSQYDFAFRVRTGYRGSEKSLSTYLTNLFDN